jgi:hypothetical protein
MRDNQIDRQVIIELLVLMDELIAECGIVPSNYAQLVLRNRPPMSGSSVPVRLSVHSPDRNRWSEMWLSVPTSWWQLPGKALSILVQNGPRVLIKSVLKYLEWLVGPD